MSLRRLAGMALAVAGLAGTSVSCGPTVVVAHLATPAVELDSVERLEDGRIDGPYPGYLIVQRPQVDQRMEDQEYRRQIQEELRELR